MTKISKKKKRNFSQDGWKIYSIYLDIFKQDNKRSLCFHANLLVASVGLLFDKTKHD